MKIIYDNHVHTINQRRDARFCVSTGNEGGSIFKFMNKKDSVIIRNMKTREVQDA